MPARTRTRRRRVALAVLAIGAPLSSGPTRALAVETHWLEPIDGAWSQPERWSAGRVPDNTAQGEVFDVLIDVAGEPYNIGIDQHVTIETLTIESPDATVALLDGGLLDGGLRVTGEMAVRDGTFMLDGGTLERTQISVPASPWSSMTPTVLFRQGVLDRVTLNGNVSQDGRVEVTGGLTVNGYYNKRPDADLVFIGDQTLGGNGELILSASPPTSWQPAARGRLLVSQGTTLRIGPDLVIHPANDEAGILTDLDAPATIENMGTLGRNDYADGELVVTAARLVNRGTINNTSSGVVTIESDVFINHHDVRGTGGQTRVDVNELENHGEITTAWAYTQPTYPPYYYDYYDDYVIAYRGSWTAAAPASYSASALNALDSGAFERSIDLTAHTLTNHHRIEVSTGGRVSIEADQFTNHGTLVVETDARMTLNIHHAPTGEMHIAPGGQVFFTGHNTISQPLSFRENAVLSLAGDWSIDAPVRIESSALRIVNGAAPDTIMPRLGNVTFDDAVIHLTGDLDNSDATFSIDHPDVTYAIENGSTLRGGRIISQQDRAIRIVPALDTIDGTTYIIRELPGGLPVRPATETALVDVQIDADIDIASPASGATPWRSSPSIPTLDDVGGTLAVRFDGDWSSTGRIIADQADIEFAGRFDADSLAGIEFSRTTARITGQVSAADQTLHLGGTDTLWLLSERAVIIGGRITADATSTVHIIPTPVRFEPDLRLEALELAAPVTVDHEAMLRLAGGVIVDADIRLLSQSDEPDPPDPNAPPRWEDPRTYPPLPSGRPGGRPRILGASLTLGPTQTLTGTGRVLFGGSGVAAVSAEDGLLVIEDGFTIVTDGASGELRADAAIVNHGDIQAITPDRTITLEAPTIDNAGRLHAAAGGSLAADAELLINRGTIDLAETGSLTVAGNFVQQDEGVIRLTIDLDDQPAIEVLGLLSLDGELELLLSDAAIALTPGDYPLISFGDPPVGAFDEVLFPDTDQAVSFEVFERPGDLALRITATVPEPATATILTIAFALHSRRGRRRPNGKGRTQNVRLPG